MKSQLSRFQQIQNSLARVTLSAPTEFAMPCLGLSAIGHNPTASWIVLGVHDDVLWHRSGNPLGQVRTVGWPQKVNGLVL